MIWFELRIMIIHHEPVGFSYQYNHYDIIEHISGEIQRYTKTATINAWCYYDTIELHKQQSWLPT